MVIEVEEVVARLADKQQSRIWGKHRGLVVEVPDDNPLCQISVSVPSVYGEQTSPPAMPCLPFAGNMHGLVLMPEVGDGVWVEFEAGDISRPIWTGFWFADGQHPGKTKKPKERVLATSAGHCIVLDEDSDEISLRHPGGASIVLSADGITLKMGGCTLEVTDQAITLNGGMAKITKAGASLVNDAFKVGG